MNIKGLDYNTERERLVMSEYGREIQMMVDYCKQLPEKEKRQHCAEAIVKVMRIMAPQGRETAGYEQKLWDHLAIMSNFELDIDYPFPIAKRDDLDKRPQPLSYPMQKIRMRHYGHLIEKLFGQLKDMEDGPERDELIRLTANQMKRSLYLWNPSSVDEERVADDLARFTDGAVQLNLAKFTFAKVNEKTMGEAPGSQHTTGKKKKKK
jgi:diadenosine tetraphosphatase ApaH/serine/threonine PP2A family protein phosphatase